MINLVKCHFYYLVNKNSLIILITSIVLICINYISYSFYEDFSINLHELLSEYLTNSIFITKILIPFISIFIFANCISNDNYSYFILTNTKRGKYIISKIILNIILSLIIILILLILFLIIGIIFIKGFYFRIDYLINFLNIFFICIIYGMYSMILMQLVNNNLVIFIIFSILIFSINQEYEINLILLIFPNGFLVNNTLLNYLHLLWLSLILFLVNIKVYEKKDLNY